MTNTKPITNIAFYKFVELADPQGLQSQFTALCTELQIKGTILLAHEGINGMLSGEGSNIEKWVGEFLKISEFSNVAVKRSYSDKPVFRKLLIKVKKEILTLRREDVAPHKNTAPYMTPQDL